MKKEISLAKEKTMTVKEIAYAMAVSVATIQRCINRIMPNKMKHGKQTFLTENEVALISKELKGNNKVLEQLTVTAGETVKNTTTELELFANYRQSTEQLVNYLNEKNKELESENKVLLEKLGQEKSYRTIKAVEMLTGKHFKYSELKKCSKENGYPIHKVFDQNYGEVNAYHIDVWQRCYGVEI